MTPLEYYDQNGGSDHAWNRVRQSFEQNTLSKLHRMGTLDRRRIIALYQLEFEKLHHTKPVLSAKG